MESLKAALLEGLGITDDSQVRVRVLATELSRFNGEQCRTAVVSFGLDFYLRSQAGFFDYAAINGLSDAISAGLRDSTGVGAQATKGVTPLMRLLDIRCDGGARPLVAQGMDVRARDDFGRSVQFCAKSVEMVQMLLDAGAEVNGIWTSPLIPLIGQYKPAYCGIGLNALMYHVEDVGIVKCLLQPGAEVDDPSLTGETALQYACSKAVTSFLLAKRPRLESMNTDDDRLSDTICRAAADEITPSLEEHHQGNDPPDPKISSSARQKNLSLRLAERLRTGPKR